MRSILEELFYGNVCPNTDCRNNDKETTTFFPTLEKSDL